MTNIDLLFLFMFMCYIGIIFLLAIALTKINYILDKLQDKNV